jgi:DNA-binding NarL/FixJ family response regulator
LPGGTLLVSRAIKLFPYYRQKLLALGFQDVEVTGEEKDSLNMVINDLKPRLVLVESAFYQAGTPFMMGRLLKRFPKLNIAAVSLAEFPDSLAAWFIFHNVKSYLNLWEGYEEFSRGLEIIREGGVYISPRVRDVIDLFPEWPETNGEATARLMEVLVLLCNGFTAESIGKELHLSRKTVYNHMKRLYNTFDVQCRDEMVAKAWAFHLVTENDIRFLDRRQEAAPLPEWAAAKQKIDRSLMRKAPSKLHTAIFGGGGNEYAYEN